MADTGTNKVQPPKRSLEPNQPRRGALRGTSRNTKADASGRSDGMGIDKRTYGGERSANSNDRIGGRPSIPNVRETGNVPVVDRGLPVKVTKARITHNVK